MTIKLPEPKGYFHEWTEYGKEEKWQAITCQFDHFHEDDEPFFTEAHLKQAIKDALERAAIIAWNHYMNTCKKNGLPAAEFGYWMACDEIRKLKDQL